MNGNLILFGWDRPHAGREALSQQHFQDFIGYLTAQQQAGAIQSFEAIFLDPHGGDLNGFFLIRGEPGKLDALLNSDEWLANVVRGDFHLDGAGVIRGVTGDMIPQRFQLWSSVLSKLG